MSTRNDYTVREWHDIAAAPAASALIIACGDGPPFGPASDETAVGWVIVRSARGDAPEIVKALIDSVQRCGCRAAMPESLSGAGGHGPDFLLATVARAVEAVGSTSLGEVEPFKAWLAAIAAKLFHATKAAQGARGPQGARVRGGQGARGMEVVPVTRGEQAAIDRLSAVLGIAAPAPAAGLTVSRSRSSSMLQQPRFGDRQAGQVRASHALLCNQIGLMTIRVADD